jgi:hypothetical protein
LRSSSFFAKWEQVLIEKSAFISVVRWKTVFLTLDRVIWQIFRTADTFAFPHARREPDEHEFPVTFINTAMASNEYQRKTWLCSGRR